MVRKCSLTCSVFVIIAGWPSPCLCDDAVDIHIKQDEITLDKTLSTMWRSTIRTDPLPAGKRVLIEIPVVNDSASDLLIANLETDCGCSRSEFSTDHWRVGDSATLKVWATVPKQRKNAQFRTAVVATATTADLLGDTLQIHFEVRSPIREMLAFVHDMNPVAVHADMEQRVRIPLICTVSNPQIKVEAAGALSGLDFQFDANGDKSHLICILDPALLPNRTCTAKVTVRDENTGTHDTTLVMLERPEPVKISPPTLRFRSVKGTWRATGILQLNDGMRPDKALSPVSDKSATAAPYIELTIGGRNATAKATRLSDGLYRLNIAMRDLEENEPTNPRPELKWRIVWKRDTHTLDARAVFHQD